MTEEIFSLVVLKFRPAFVAELHAAGCPASPAAYEDALSNSDMFHLLLSLGVPLEAGRLLYEALVRPRTPPVQDFLLTVLADRTPLPALDWLFLSYLFAHRNINHIKRVLLFFNKRGAPPFTWQIWVAVRLPCLPSTPPSLSSRLLYFYF